MLNGKSSPFIHGGELPRPQRVQQKQVRLSAERKKQLVDRYRAGALQRELAAQYGVNRRTVAEIVKQHGATKCRRLTSRQIDQAVVAYLNGHSLATIAKQLGVTDNTVRSRLLERGVEMRDARGAAR